MERTVPSCMLIPPTFLAPGAEISRLFDRLSEPEECIPALSRLIDIAEKQEFLVSARKIAQILRIVQDSEEIFSIVSTSPTRKVVKHARSLDSIRESDYLEGLHVCQSADAVRDLALTLLNRIASFDAPIFAQYFMRQISRRHVDILCEYLSNEIVLKLLGKLIPRSLPLAARILEKGITGIDIAEEKYSLLIWFVGSFAYHAELNTCVVPLFESIILPALSSAPLVKYAIDSILILVENSQETLAWIAEHPRIASVFDTTVDREDTAYYVLKLAHRLISAGLTGIASIRGLRLLLSSVVGSACSMDLKEEAFNISAEMSKGGRWEDVVCLKLDEAAFAVMNLDFPYMVKQSAMNALCCQFVVVPAAQKRAYIGGNIMQVVHSALTVADECDNIYEPAMRALVAAVNFALEERDEYALALAQEVAGDIEYDNDDDEVMEYILNAEI